MHGRGEVQEKWVGIKLAGGGFGLLVSMLLLGASTRAAHAYLDPGTGSMILQVLLGGVAGLRWPESFTGTACWSCSRIGGRRPPRRRRR